MHSIFASLCMSLSSARMISYVSLDCILKRPTVVSSILYSCPQVFFFIICIDKSSFFCFFFFNDTATTEIHTYSLTLPLPDALPICDRGIERPGHHGLLPDGSAGKRSCHRHRALVPLGRRRRAAQPPSARDRSRTGQRRLAWPNGFADGVPCAVRAARSEEHTSELQSLMRTSYAVFCLKKQKN